MLGLKLVNSYVAAPEVALVSTPCENDGPERLPRSSPEEKCRQDRMKSAHHPIDFRLLGPDTAPESHNFLNSKRLTGI